MADMFEKPNRDEYNPAERIRIAEQAAQNQVEAGLRDNNSTGLDEDTVGQKESDGGVNSPLGSDSSFDSSEVGKRRNKDGSTQTISRNPSSKPTSRQIARKLTGSLRGRLGIIGLLTTFGVSGGLLVAFFGPASMLINVSQNLALNNDSSSTVLERRLFKVLNSALSSDSADLCASSNKIRCKQGRIGNNVLRKMASNGIVPMRNGTPMNPGRTGYAKQNPTHFRINGTDVSIKDLPSHLSKPENKGLAGKVYGRRGVINMQVRAWAGKHISGRFFTKLNISRKGGVVSRAMKSLAANERVKNVKNSYSKLSGQANRISTLASNKVSKGIIKAGNRAGPAYALAVGACATVKAPKYIAAGVAAIELISLVKLVSDIVLGPGTSAQMQGLDDTISFTGEDAEVVGKALTETTPRESDSKHTSALDSKYLLTALGVSSSKLPMSSFVPGYGALNSPALNALATVEDNLEPACNVIMAPGTMYSMMAGNAVVTVAASATVIGGIVKVAGSWLISSAAAAIGGMIVEGAAKAAIEALAETDAIDSAVGEKLGDALGVAATAFFASGSMSRLIPGTTMSRLAEFNDIKQEQEEFQKQMDIASLSPFDTSSRYTLLGSIVHNLQVGMLQSGNFNNSLSSVVSNIMRLPATALSFSKTVNAATEISTQLCGYAEEFGLNTGDPNTEPAINMAGMPCTGITHEMDSMTMDEAITILADEEGWIDKNVDIPDGATIDDLISIGFIIKDTPMTDYIEDCGDPSTGDYLFNSASCVIADGDGDADEEELNRRLDLICENVKNDTVDSTNPVTKCYSEETALENSGEASADAPSSRSLMAAVVFLIDYQVSSILSGDDDGDTTIATEGSSTDSTEGSSTDSTAGLPPSEGKIVSPVPEGVSAYISAGYGAYPSSGKAHWGIDFAGSGWSFRSICDGTIKQVSNNGDRNGAKTNYIWIQCDGSNIYTGYAHYYHSTIQPYVKVGARVTAGTPLAKVGNQGNSTGTHLHFQINPKRIGKGTYNSKDTINPLCYLKSQGVTMNYATPKGHRGC